jgi:ABC-2 type transport system ATP-binding protein
VTIILTTHYIEEAEEMADRIGVIHQGRLIVVEDKQGLMRELGRKHLSVQLETPLAVVPAALSPWSVSLAGGGTELVYRYDTRAPQGPQGDIAGLLRALDSLGLGWRDLRTEQDTLEDIFVGLVGTARGDCE